MSSDYAAFSISQEGFQEKGGLPVPSFVAIRKTSLALTIAVYVYD